MPTINGYTAERMKEIEDSAIVDGDVVGDNLILKRFDLGEINAGNVRGPQGIQGPTGTGGIIPVTSTTRPSSPTDGMYIYETDTDRLLHWNGTAWVLPKNVAGGIIATPGSTNGPHVGFSSTASDIPSCSTTFTVIAGRRYRLKAEIRQARQQTVAGLVTFQIMEGTTEISRWISTLPAGNWFTCAIEHPFIIAPSIGSHTYKLMLSTNAGTVDISAGTPAAFITAEDVGSI